MTSIGYGNILKASPTLSELMIRQIILCLTLIAAQIAGQSVCCCQFGDDHGDAVGDHGHTHHHSDHHSSHSHGHSHALVFDGCQISGCQISGCNECDGGHDHHCNCESPNTVLGAGRIQLLLDDDRHSHAIGSLYLLFGDSRDAIVKSGQRTIPMLSQWASPRAHFGIWRL